jgi:ubiquinone/menaquinone biosynthesis C-methylase UbiE
MIRILRVRVVLFLFSAILIVSALYLTSSICNTLDRLDIVEAERDRWQRPADVLRALDARPGSSVVDLGSGAGYFTLKLADTVGDQGKVVAVDLRRLSLSFLRIRAMMRNQHNVDIIVATPNDPQLRAGVADAVLICNTYHEFVNPARMLDHTFRALRPGGRLVIVDRAPDAGGESARATHGHEVSPELAEAELRRKHFQIVSRNDRFIDRPGDEPWWLLVASRP